MIRTGFAGYDCAAALNASAAQRMNVERGRMIPRFA
jgi:hypothetical protein